MDLQQEYFNRHNIKTPLVVYPDTRANNSLVLKNEGLKVDGMPRYFIVTVAFHKQETHPSYYKFVIHVPAHDATAYKSIWEKKVFWDEWEPFILSWAEANKGELIPLNGDDLSLAVWEMFQYSHDSWLANNLQDRLKDVLCVAVDDEIAVEERFEAHKEVEEFIRGKNQKVHNALTGLRTFQGKACASWLAVLLGGQNDS